MVIPPPKSWLIKEHALFQMERRDISKAMVDSVLEKPEQSEQIRLGRTVYQKKIEFGDPPKDFLLRVFVDTDRSPAEVVTVYKTTRFEKYWR